MGINLLIADDPKNLAVLGLRLYRSHVEQAFGELL